MRRLRFSIASLLLALWLPATLFCEMETAGLLTECGTCHGEGASDGMAADCDADGGGVIESGALRLPVPVFLPSAFDAMPWLLIAVLPPEITSQPPLPLDRTAAPVELNRTWQFAVRAAPPPRAPNFMV